jgi:hypothetical protein
VTWTPDDRAVMGVFILAVALVLSWRSDRERFHGMGESIRGAWASTVGAWFPRRRMKKRVRISRGPSEACRRELNCGSWT